jgi:hypothetical protein
MGTKGTWAEDNIGFTGRGNTCDYFIVVACAVIGALIPHDVDNAHICRASISGDVPPAFTIIPGLILIVTFLLRCDP